MHNILFVILLLVASAKLFSAGLGQTPKHRNIENIQKHTPGKDETNLSFSKGIGHHSNVFEIRENEDSTYHHTTISSYYTPYISKKLSKTLSFEYNDKLFINDTVKTYDERYITPGYEISKKISRKEILGISYFYTYEMERLKINNDFSTYRNIHEVTPNYSLKNDIHNYSIEVPIKYTNFSNYPETNDYGIKFNYNNHGPNKYIYPGISIGYNLISETDQDIAHSKDAYISLYNYFYPSSKFSGYMQFDFTRRYNSSGEYAYLDYMTTLYLSYAPKIIKGLSTNLQYTYEHTRYKSDDRINISEIKMDLTYSFL